MKRQIICSIVIIFSTYSFAFASYGVKGKGVSSVLYSGGKATVTKSDDEVVYIVDLENKKVTRTGVFNAGIKEGPLSGLQADSTEYKIIYDMADDLVTRGKNEKSQHIIKAIGQTGVGDGYETIVIGEDFIMTSNSKFDYFVLYYYKILK